MSDPVAIQESPLAKVSSELHQCMSELEEAQNNLFSRIAYVLSPEPPSDESLNAKGPMEGGLSNLELQLTELKARIIHRKEDVQKVLARVRS